MTHHKQVTHYPRPMCLWSTWSMTHYDPRDQWPTTHMTHNPRDPWPTWPMTYVTHDPSWPTWPITHDPCDPWPTWHVTTWPTWLVHWTLVSILLNKVLATTTWPNQACNRNTRKCTNITVIDGHWVTSPHPWPVNHPKLLTQLNQLLTVRFDNNCDNGNDEQRRQRWWWWWYATLQTWVQAVGRRRHTRRQWTDRHRPFPMCYYARPRDDLQSAPYRHSVSLESLRQLTALKTRAPSAVLWSSSSSSIFISATAHKTYNDNIISPTKPGNQKGKCPSCRPPITQTR